uniref:Polyprenal reductase n=1 Tax=Angiostrongylus cantonensis TaxID=6313 RepID=A0A0K0DES8_ANGCA
MLPLLPSYLVVVTLGLSLACTLTLFVPSCPSIVPALTTYGVSALYLRDKIKFIQVISVPKRFVRSNYLSHLKRMDSLELNFIQQGLLQMVLAFLFGRVILYNWSTTVLALFLILFHVVRRLWETLCISVYSDTTMNIFHYIVGLVHYIILPLTIMCESQSFAEGKYSKSFSHRSLISAISPWQWFGTALFLICNREQHHISRDIAALRRAPDGLVFNYCYGICYGGWFEYVSCPHFLFEIGIYLSLWMVLWRAYAFRFLAIFVVVNQLFAGLITHRWYQRTFKAYPLNRRAVVPYIL